MPTIGRGVQWSQSKGDRGKAPQIPPKHFGGKLRLFPENHRFKSTGGASQQSSYVTRTKLREPNTPIGLYHNAIFKPLKGGRNDFLYFFIKSLDKAVNVGYNGITKTANLIGNQVHGGRVL